MSTAIRPALQLSLIFIEKILMPGSKDENRFVI
jgi:hypothetical protein